MMTCFGNGKAKQQVGKNFTKDKPGSCAHDCFDGHDFQLRSIWTDTYVALMSLGTGVQVVSVVLPFAYKHCRHCNWKEISTIIDKATVADKETGLPVSKEVFVYSGVAGEKEAAQQMVEILREHCKVSMESRLKVSVKDD